MTHPKEHLNNPTYWAQFLAEVVRNAVRDLRAGRVGHAREQLQIAQQDFQRSPFGDKP